MINYQIFGLCRLLDQLYVIQNDLEMRIGFINAEIQHGGGYQAVVESNIPHEVTDADKQIISGWLEFAIRQADQLELQPVLDRIDRFKVRLRNPINLHDFLSEVRTLRETFDSGINFKYFYRYPHSKAVVLLKFEADWKLINDRFPSARLDAQSAVDCWALGHGTASVFHLMRVSEYGLRSLARERRVKLPKKQVLEWADWHGIIEGIRKRVDLIANKKRGPKRDAALEFYRGAMASFEGFKDAYRNNVMHARKSYADLEATAIKEQVFHFMNRLAEKIEESGKVQIKWGI
jgi:hypothetical protein